MNLDYPNKYSVFNRNTVKVIIVESDFISGRCP
jgi:hypothetical protein